MHWDKLVIASNNTGKISELASFLKPFVTTLVPQAELGIDDAEETASTFVENALIKARHAAKLSGLPSLADDSGIAVAALNGAPGVQSARYAGNHGDANANIQKLLTALKKIPKENRHAYFYCVIVLINHANDPMPTIAIGKWHGLILETPQGEGGFGYDPIFYVPEENKSAAELSRETKSKLSHRGKALASLITQLGS